MRSYLEEFKSMLAVSFLAASMLSLDVATAADKIVALYSAHAVPYSMPWVAEGKLKGDKSNY